MKPKLEVYRSPTPEIPVRRRFLGTFRVRIYQKLVEQGPLCPIMSITTRDILWNGEIEAFDEDDAEYKALSLCIWQGYKEQRRTTPHNRAITELDIRNNGVEDGIEFDHEQISLIARKPKLTLV